MDSGTRIPGKHGGIPNYHIDVGRSGSTVFLKHGNEPSQFKFEMTPEQARYVAAALSIEASSADDVAFLEQRALQSLQDFGQVQP